MREITRFGTRLKACDRRVTYLSLDCESLSRVYVSGRTGADYILVQPELYRNIARVDLLN